MVFSLCIFFLAFSVRLLNLYLNNIDINTYLVEDQLMYWEWATNNAYTKFSSIDRVQLLERMPGSFLFFQFCIWLLGENIFNVLLVQIAIDSITCVIIALICRTINSKLFFYSGMIASFSPLLIIISSQILSDTIFLFFFSSYIYFFMNFILKRKLYFIYIAAFFLALALFTRVVVLPVIFITYFYTMYFFYKDKLRLPQIIKVTLIFFLISFSISLPRIINNYYNYDTLALSTQSGSHLSFWVVPGILDFETNQTRLIYKEKIQRVEKKIETDPNPFSRSSKLKNEAIKTLSSVNKLSVILAWTKGAILNTFSPSIMLDKRIRSVPHPSFYENDRNLKQWISKVLFDNRFGKYKIILFISLITSAVFTFLIFIGFTMSLKIYFKEAIILYLIIIYFLAVTGPVFSPKYIHPILPAFIFFEALALKSIHHFFKKFFKKT